MSCLLFFHGQVLKISTCAIHTNAMHLVRPMSFVMSMLNKSNQIKNPLNTGSLMESTSSFFVY